MYTLENLDELLGKRFIPSFETRLMFLHYSKLYDNYGFYFVSERSNPAYHPDWVGVTAEKICEFLNNPNYTIEVLPGYFDGG